MENNKSRYLAFGEWPTLILSYNYKSLMKRALFFFFVPVVFLLNGCMGTSIPKGLSPEIAQNMSTVMVAQVDLKCNLVLHTIHIKKGTIFEAKSIEGIKMGGVKIAGRSIEFFPDYSIFLNTDVFDLNVMGSIHGPVVFPNGKFIFKEALYFQYNSAEKIYFGSGKCKFPGDTPFKMITK